MSGAIAVVVTCYDLGRYLAEAVESVRSQTRPAAEILVVDDGSRDLYTRQVLARLERAGTRVARSENRGVSAARNLGTRLTAGEYLVHLDADDVLEPTYFEKAAGRLDTEPELDFVSCAMRGFEGASYVWVPAASDFVQAVAAGGVPHVSTMLRRRVWEAIGGYDETFPAHEDLEFWATVLERGSRGIVLDEPLLGYRVRPRSNYHRAIEPRAHLALMERLYRKHQTAVERHGLDILVAKEAFLRGQRDHRRHLEEQRAAMEAELTTLRQEIDRLGRALAERGVPRVDWGDLRRQAPLSPVWGLDRGKPVNRYYVERFLAAHREDIRGRVLEVKDPGYTDMFGSGVTQRDVLDVDGTNPRATIVTDLTRAEAVPSESFDCFVLTQVLNVVYDVRSALRHAARILRPGGVLLCTVAALDRVSYEDRGPDGDYWRFTEASLRELLAEAFPLDAFEVTTYGNVMACTAHLYGLAAEELARTELDHQDPGFPLIVAARAVKPGAARVTAGEPAAPAAGAILAYHRIARLGPDPHGLCLAPEDFRAQLEHLAARYRVMALEDLAAALRAGALPPRAVAVTLDDGYADALTTASPILLTLGVPATFFVTTERLDEEHELLWDLLERIFLGGQPIPRALDLELGGHAYSRATATPAERRAAHDWLTEATYAASAEARAAVVRRLAEWSGLDLAPRPTHRVLTADEVRQLAARPGHAIAAHTARHLVLPAQPLDVQREEIGGSRARLESLLGRPVRALAYPYGEHGPDTVEIARAAGLAVAVTCEAAPVYPDSDPLRLPRVEAPPGGAAALETRLAEFFRNLAVR